MNDESGPLGILMLDTRFPRIVGDIGNAQSFDFPVIFRRMEGIGSADAVTTHPDRPRVLAALEANARALVAEGAVGLSTSCGFLALYQDDLAARSPVPVATSRCCTSAAYQSGQAGRRDHRVGAQPDAGAFRRRGRAGRHTLRRPARRQLVRQTFIGNATTLDRAGRARGRGCCRDLAGAPSRHRHDRVRMHQPAAYKKAVQDALGLPVFDVLDLLKGFYARLTTPAGGGRQAAAG